MLFKTKSSFHPCWSKAYLLSDPSQATHFNSITNDHHPNIIYIHVMYNIMFIEMSLSTGAYECCQTRFFYTDLCILYSHRDINSTVVFFLCSTFSTFIHGIIIINFVF